MLGALLGDYVGSRFQLDNCKSKDFELFNKDCRFTDDTVLSIAVAKTITENYPIKYDWESVEKFKNILVENFVEFVNKYPNREYGERFCNWAHGISLMPYGSWGNGAAMRISPVGWYARSENEVKKLSKIITEVTHNTKEAIRGAEAIAMCIYLARIGKTKEQIKEYVIKNYYEELLFLDYKDLLENYSFDCSTEGSVPVAIYSFLISNNFEDAIRTAVSVGGDTDTIACMTGAIAEAYYMRDKDTAKLVNEFLKLKILTEEFIKIYEEFINTINGKKEEEKNREID